MRLYEIDGNSEGTVNVSTGHNKVLLSMPAQSAARALLAHDDLVKALKACMSILDSDYGMNAVRPDHSAKIVFDMGTAALAKAGA